jgi:aspartyl-tRNA synthetase
MGIGLDRLVMQMLQCDSLRDVIAYPKVQNASELMTMCPAEVDPKQLEELHIQLLDN